MLIPVSLPVEVKCLAQRINCQLMSKQECCSKKSADLLYLYPSEKYGSYIKASTVSCFWSSIFDKFSEIHFLTCFCQGRFVIVEFRMNFCHALILKFFRQRAWGNLRSFPSMSVEKILLHSVLFHSYWLSISPHFNGQLFIRADACLSHDAYCAAAASFLSDPIKLQTAAREDNKRKTQIFTKGFFLDSPPWLW